MHKNYSWFVECAEVAGLIFSDGLQVEIAPLLPLKQAKLKGGWPRTIDRVVLTGILLVSRWA